MNESPKEAPRQERREPHGILSIRTLAIPADTNPYRDIFGGWLLGQMDVAGGIFSATIAHGRTATVSADAMTFHQPAYVGDVICVYNSFSAIFDSPLRTHFNVSSADRDQ